MSEVAVELAGNSHEHAKSNCLIDIDVAPGYSKIDREGNYYGVNLVVLNLSDILMGYGIKDKINNKCGDRYNSVSEAYINHSKYFDSNYTEEDFFIIASFQDKISGNKDKFCTGGKGLTKLIASLEERSDTYCCYMISGNRILNFAHDVLEYDNDGWIGFNDEKNFLECLPRKNVIGTNNMYFPGTAYNLNFVLKKEDEDNE